MIEWNRDAASLVQITLVIVFFILLISKRRKLWKGTTYFIAATAIVIGLEIFIFVIRRHIYQFNSQPYYTIFTNLFVFLLFFLYFRSILVFEKSRRLNLLMIILFLILYVLFALLSENFFSKFSIKFYFIEVILLIGNIYLVLKETFNSDKVLNIIYYYPFWACIGLMSIYLGVTPLLIISNTGANLININIFFIILFVVNFIGYSILITGILFAKNINYIK